MMREFTYTDGKKWKVSESGAYFGYGAVSEGEHLQASIADVEFECETGQRAYGTMARGAVERVPEEQLREVLKEALDAAAP